MRLLQELSVDAQFYRSLRSPGNSGRLALLYVWGRSPGFFLLAMHRLARRWQQSGARGDSLLCKVLLRAALFIGRPLLVVRTTSDIVGSTDIAPGVYLSDRGNLIIGARSIGSGTLIHHAVTIGMGLMNQGKPQIGRNVWIGPDCVIYGAIDIGDGATVLPGSVLSRSIPPRTVVSGNPSRIVRANFDNGPLRDSLAYDVDIGSLPAREI